MKNKWNDRKVQRYLLDKLKARMELATAFVRDAAVLLCPVDTGNLRNSIVNEVSVQKNIVRGRIGTNVEYAPYVEFGTGKYAENGLGRKGGWYYEDEYGNVHFTYGSRPQPFLRPALWQNKAVIRRILTL